MKRTLKISSSLILISFFSLTTVSCKTHETIIKYPSYYDDRTSAQIKDHNIIESKSSDDKFIKEKKVIIYGIDGVEFDNLNKHIINDKSKENINFKQEFSIQNYESIRGWTSITYGNMFWENKTIFEMLKNSDLKSGMVSAWTGWKNKILFDETDSADEWIDISNDNPEFEEMTLATVNDVIEKIEYTNEIVDKLIINSNNNFSLFMHYDTIADNLGHAGFGYDSEQVKTAYNLYEKRMEYYFSDEIANDENTLVIGITDHGRDKNGKGHNEPDRHNRKGWVISNKNLNDYTGIDEYRNFQNFYDIKNVIFNFLRDNE